MEDVGFETVMEEGDPVLRVSGQLDLSTSVRLREKLRGLAQAEHPRIRLDLHQVRYIDSSGMAAIIDISRLLHRQRRELVITGASRRVQRVFRVLGLGAMLAHLKQ